MEVPQELIHDWSREKWLEKKRKLAECVWFEAALLRHPDSDMIYAAPEPTQYGVVYELRAADVVEVVRTDRQKAKLDQVYEIARVYVKRDAVVIRQQWMVAVELPNDCRSLSTNLEELERQTTSEALVDRGGAIVPLKHMNGGGSEGGGKKGDGGGGGSGVSGVRG